MADMADERFAVGGAGGAPPPSCGESAGEPSCGESTGEPV